jgi:hypothetical protein
VLQGWVSEFWEQGMEEAPWLIFQDHRYTNGESWDRAGMHRLAPGGTLTIFADGRSSVLWSGVLRQRRLGLLGVLGPRSLTPNEVNEATWVSWFRRSPSLQADYCPPAA